MPRAPNPTRDSVRGPATLGDFVLHSGRDAFPTREWVATLADLVEVVIGDSCDSPGAVDVQKAVSIVQSRAYLEHRARRLLLPFTKEEGSWRLATIDFVIEARRQGCEFMMCFAFRATKSALSITSPAVDIGFALQRCGDTDPIFVLAVVTAAGLPVQLDNAGLEEV